MNGKLLPKVLGIGGVLLAASPLIFNVYGVLSGFSGVRPVVGPTLDTFWFSLLFGLGTALYIGSAVLFRSQQSDFRPYYLVALAISYAPFLYPPAYLLLLLSAVILGIWGLIEIGRIGMR